MLFNAECPVCGKTFIIDTSAKGRPGIYCSKECGTIEKYYFYAMNHLEKLNMTKEARTYWKSRLFGDRNLVFKEGR